MARHASVSMVTPRLNVDRGRCSGAGLNYGSMTTLSYSNNRMSLPRVMKPMGCVGFRGNNRLLIVAGMVVLTCYVMSELVLRSWTLDDPDVRWARDCLSMRSVNPSLPESPCGRHVHLGVEVEKKAIDGAYRGEKKQKPQTDIGAPTEHIGATAHQVNVVSNNYEIDVESSDLQPRLVMPHRSIVHRNPARGRSTAERTSPIIRDASALRSAHLQGDLRNMSHRQSLWTLWESSKNGSHLEYLSKDVLKYRHALQEKLRGSTMSPAMVAMERKYYSRNPKRINPHDFTVMLNASKVCEDNPFLIVIIPSLPSSRDRRNAIRETWGSVTQNNTWPNDELKATVKIAFLLGRTESFHIRMVIKQENEQYGDIVQEDFLESYRNLSLKTVMGIKWVLNSCNRAKYIMKCDDDMIAHIPMVLKLLTGHKYQNSIIGHINKGAVVQRQGLWALSPEEFPFDHFPPYASGTAYIISADLIKPLYQMSEHVPLVPIEDAYITGIIGRMLGVSLIHQNGFTSWNSFSPRTCDLILGRIFTGTKMTSNSLRRMWQRIKTGGPNCNRDAPNIVMARMSRNE